MSFRRRNIGIISKTDLDAPSTAAATPKVVLPGVRPSPIDGRSITSTGTSALDGLLAGHGGLALGSSLLIEEGGTTDYAGALLKFYAAEGLLQGHHVHVVGFPEQWGRELPGAIDDKGKNLESGSAGEKMKIAWRYEGLGQFGSSTISREAPHVSQADEAASDQRSTQSTPFIHSFDLTKRLVHPASSTINFIPLVAAPNASPFTSVLTKLKSLLVASSPETVHRLLLPNLLSPLLYPPQACNPSHLLSFLHSIRSLLSVYHLTAMLSLPLSLHPRSTGLARWIELLSDGVFELAPFPHTSVAIPAPSPSAAPTEEPPQGLLRIHKVPILHELGSGTRSYDDDWTFSLSRRKLNIMPFNLPPLEGDTEAQKEALAAQPETNNERKGKKARKEDLDF